MSASHEGASYSVSPGPPGIATSPRRRQQVVQPPNLLTTTPGNARHSGLGIGGLTQTPVFTTSLSSPFSAYPSSPGGAMRGSSPMALRSQVAFTTNYNPQQWGPVSNGSPNSSSAGDHRQARSSRTQALAPRFLGPDEPVASPPPPYSPRRDAEPRESLRRPVEVVSPSDTTSPDTDTSRYGTPVSAATTLSPDLVSQYPNGPSPVLHQQVSPRDSQSTVAGAPAFPPPPPKGPSQRHFTTSKRHADRLLSSLTLKGKTSNAELPGNAIDTLQQSTRQLLAQASEPASIDDSTRAPAARRAASTGGIGVSGGSSRTNSQSPSLNTWEPGMPLPPPPPGPPPAAARSQSLNRPLESPSQGLASTLPFRQRRPPGRGTTLDTVPPTPADWREEVMSNNLPVSSPRSVSKGRSPLHIDTGSILQRKRFGDDCSRPTATAATSAHARRDSSTRALFRSPAVRDRSAKGIRERRSESRNGKSRVVDESAIEPPSVAPWDQYDDMRPTNLVLTGSQSSNSKHALLHKSTPKSSKSMQSLDGALNSAGMNVSSGKAASFTSSHSTPQAESSFSPRLSAVTSTPPYSPDREVRSRLPGPMSVSHAAPAKTSSLSPLSSSSGPALSLVVPPRHEQRPLSHLLHIPNPDESMQIPLTPSTREPKEKMGDLIGPESSKAFAGRAIERHRMFAEREAAASSDSERLDLFIQYVTAESRIRREQYASVFDEEGIEIQDLTQGLFEHPSTKQRSCEKERSRSRADTSKRTSIASSALEDSSSQGEASTASRMHESPSSATTNSSTQHRPESTWWRDYVPSLSPIASMSIVTGQDEMDSRGRAPSRWWEDRSCSGDAIPGDAFKVLERSKRESKYMGVPRSLPAVYEGGASASTGIAWRSSAEVSQQPGYGSDEYPPEKVDWHKQDQTAPSATRLPPTPQSAPYTPDPRKLDISRLVTLPPPYPRHHPAVNNGHPDLADVRAVVRSLNEKDEPDSIKETYRIQMQGKRQRADSWCKHQHSMHRQDIDSRKEHGGISQQQYDRTQMDLEAAIHDSEKEIVQADFDLFQESVLTPLHAIFSDRIKLANCSLDKLSSRLFSDAQSHSPNLPQEEGDEEPELLEKLTQLKWLFEARENLHQQIYDLLSERNDRYRAIVLLPYKQTQNHAKHSEAEVFFAQDAQERRLAFQKAIYSRAQAFLCVIENNVSRGVEVQLSAFWDIAPSLLELLHKVPSGLDDFEIQISANEYEENPTYYDHPLQYLYSLLCHAQKSSYQFIESQINLLCLLHEIRSHTLIARCRVQAQSSARSWAVEEEQWKEEQKLTEDLKEKVAVIEGQWEEALGSELIEVRERVRGRLLEEEGFDEEDV